MTPRCRKQQNPQTAFLHMDLNSRLNELLSHIEIGPDNIMIDCGANVGVVTQAFADLRATVYSFEPNPYAFNRLRDRFQSVQNVTCFQKAVLDRTTVIRLYLHEHAQQDQVVWSTGSSIIEEKNNVDPKTFVDVEAIDLSQFVLDLKTSITLLKMDIEGAEYATLTKLINTGAYAKIEHIVVETHETKIPELRPAHGRLVELIAEKRIQNIDLSWI